MNDIKGDGVSFDKNWQETAEAGYLHWTRNEPENQIQLAFRRHWLTFQRLIGEHYGNKKCLEVGCGRGSLSAYFADAGWDCTLLDISDKAIGLARDAFIAAGLEANFDVGDCLQLPYEDNSFDLVFSIGLLEHFENYDTVIEEQVRILKPGALFIGYVVPELPENLQKNYVWVNELLQALFPEEVKQTQQRKTDIYRSDELSPGYIRAMEKFGLKQCQAMGIYSLPMISYSPSFPFTLLPAPAEQVLTRHFIQWLEEREKRTGQDPWLCKEGDGQAFLIWGWK